MRTVSLTKFVVPAFVAVVIVSGSNSLPGEDGPRIVYVEGKQLLYGPPRVTHQKYYFTRQHFPADAKEACTLQIANAVLDDGCFRLISEHPELREIVLQEVNVGDAELALVLSNCDCEYLNVIGTNITDASIQLLVREKSLKKVFIYNTAITHEGAKQLKKLRPELEVWKDVWNDEAIPK